MGAASFAVEGCWGGPSLRSKGGVFDFWLVFSSAEIKIKCEKPHPLHAAKDGPPARQQISVRVVSFCGDVAERVGGRQHFAKAVVRVEAVEIQCWVGLNCAI